jgi:uncharacterized protein
MAKKIIVDISHPAHLHFFRPAIDIWQKKGNDLIIVARDKDITLKLLDEYGLKYICLSKARKGIFGLGLELLEHEGKLLSIIRKTKPDVLLEIAGTFIVHAGVLTGTPSLVFYDTENAKLSNAITYPFATHVITPRCYQGDIGKKQITYEGYQELAYLHPNRFQPDPSVLQELEIHPDEKLFIIRFVAWESGHDVLLKGFSIDGKRRLVNELCQYGRVIITSENPLPPDLELYRMKIPPSKIHHLMAYSSLFIGESATMASESAILGIPFIYVSPVGRGYTNEEEKVYELGYTIDPKEEARAIDLAIQMVRNSDRSEWMKKRQIMLNDKIDVTDWIVKFVDEFLDKD